MKRLLIGDRRPALLATIEVILKHWGYRVLASSDPGPLQSLLADGEGDLLIFGAGILEQGPEPLLAAVQQRVAAGTPLILLEDEPHPLPAGIACDRLEAPVNIFSLFELMQQHLQNHPRKNLRLAVNLPGVLCSGAASQIAEVLSLSVNGLFLKTSFRLDEGSRLRVIFPLLGMKQEVEVEGRVLYCVQPCLDNNYLQGVGIEFCQLDAATRQNLTTFLESRFLGGISATPSGELGLARDQLDRQLVLRLEPETNTEPG